MAKRTETGEKDAPTLAARVAAGARDRLGPGALVCLSVSALAGWAGQRVGVPLAWVLGPMVVTAIFSIAGVKVFTSVVGRRVGQVTIGTTLGLNMTAPVVVSLLAWLPVIVVSGLTAVLCSATVSLLLARAAQIDYKTAYFCMMPGGLAEMSNIGNSVGAEPEPIALAQAFRVAIVVLVLPAFIVALGMHGDTIYQAASTRVPLPMLAVLFAASITAVFTIRFIGLNNPWMVGALVGSSAMTAAGIVEGYMPPVLFYGGQFLIGLTIGARFRREIMVRLRRLVPLISCCALLLTTLLLGLGAAVSLVTGLDFSSAALATSPGGLPEMSITAQLLQLNVALVVAFHLIRSFIVNGFATHYLSLLSRIGFFGAEARAAHSR